MSNDEAERWVAPERQDISTSIAAVRSALEALRFGSITLTVHDARVVQLDITEKRRFNGVNGKD
ncbi:MAG TPA: YezD family protein [Sphingobium sp.]|jgi:hypothetical protein